MSKRSRSVSLESIVLVGSTKCLRTVTGLTDRLMRRDTHICFDNLSYTCTEHVVTTSPVNYELDIPTSALQTLVAL